VVDPESGEDEFEEVETHSGIINGEAQIAVVRFESDIFREGLAVIDGEGIDLEIALQGFACFFFDEVLHLALAVEPIPENEEQSIDDQQDQHQNQKQTGAFHGASAVQLTTA
jgi:hypothetical protein